MRGFGRQSIVRRYGKQGAIVTETITLTVGLGMEAVGAADSQTMGADLQGPACEHQPADFQITGKVSQHIELNKLVTWEVEAQSEVQQRVHPHAHSQRLHYSIHVWQSA